MAAPAVSANPTLTVDEVLYRHMRRTRADSAVPGLEIQSVPEALKDRVKIGDEIQAVWVKRFGEKARKIPLGNRAPDQLRKLLSGFKEDPVTIQISSEGGGGPPDLTLSSQHLTALLEHVRPNKPLRDCRELPADEEVAGRFWDRKERTERQMQGLPPRSEGKTPEERSKIAVRTRPMEDIQREGLEQQLYGLQRLIPGAEQWGGFPLAIGSCYVGHLTKNEMRDVLNELRETHPGEALPLFYIPWDGNGPAGGFSPSNMEVRTFSADPTSGFYIDYHASEPDIRWLLRQNGVRVEDLFQRGLMRDRLFGPLNWEVYGATGRLRKEAASLSSFTGEDDRVVVINSQPVIDAHGGKPLDAGQLEHILNHSYNNHIIVRRGDEIWTASLGGTLRNEPFFDPPRGLRGALSFEGALAVASDADGDLDFDPRFSRIQAGYRLQYMNKAETLYGFADAGLNAAPMLTADENLPLPSLYAKLGGAVILGDVLRMGVEFQGSAGIGNRDYMGHLYPRYADSPKGRQEAEANDYGRGYYHLEGALALFFGGYHLDFAYDLIVGAGYGYLDLFADREDKEQRFACAGPGEGLDKRACTYIDSQSSWSAFLGLRLSLF